MKNKLLNKFKALVALVLSCAYLVGCSSTPVTVAYKTEVTADTTAVAALTGWNAYVGAYHPGTNAELKVKQLFLQTQSAELALVQATYAWQLSGTNASSTNVPPLVTSAQAQYAAATSNLVNLIASLTSTNK